MKLVGISLAVGGLSFAAIGLFSIASGNLQAGLAGIILTMWGAANLHAAAHALKTH